MEQAEFKILPLNRVMNRLLTFTAFILTLQSCVEHSGESGTASGKVYVRNDSTGYTLVRNGVPFTVKGASGKPLIKELQAAGGNTLRVYDTTNLEAILDSAHKYGIALVVDLPLPRSIYIDEFYDDSTQYKPVLHAYKKVVRKHRHHPALLFWMLGNELDYPYKPRFSPFYKTYRRFAQAIKRLDTNHPVSTSLTNFTRRKVVNLRLRIPQIDFVCINTFGRLKTLEQDLDAFEWFWDGPYLVSEWGVPGYWAADLTAWTAPLEDATWSKAGQLTNYYSRSMPRKDPRFLGSLVFHWGQKQERTHTWFNLFSDKGEPNEMYEAIRHQWLNTADSAAYPPLQYIFINNRGGPENILLNAGENFEAEAVLSAGNVDSLYNYEWSLLPEDWFSLFLNDVPPIISLKDYLLFKKGRKVKFKVPPDRGAYRLYVKVEKKGRVAMANIPFYVMN